MFGVFLLSTTSIVAKTSQFRTQQKGTERITLSQDEVIDGDYFTAGETVEVFGTVNGDVYAAGGQVVIDGTVNGDVLAAGGMITVSGQVNGNVRVAGGQILVSGGIGKNLTVGGGSVEIVKGAQLRGNLVTGAGNVTVASPIGGDITAGVGNLTIAEAVGRDVVAGVGVLRLAPGGNIGGDLTYWSENEGDIDPTATVSGIITRQMPPTKRSEVPKDAFAAVFTGLKFISFLSWMLVGLLLIRFVPHFMERSVGTLTADPWKAVGIGILTLIVTPIAALLLFITVVGFPLGILLIVIFLISIYFVKFIVLYWLGSFITERFGQKQNPYWTFVIGAVLYFIITLVPVIAFFVQLATVIVGLGTLILLKKTYYHELHGKKMI